MDRAGHGDWRRRAGLPSSAANPSVSGELLTEAQAKELALARLPGASSIRLKLEYDDGRHVYEGEMIHGHGECDFELDAVTGEFLEWDYDHHD
jgi:uncharacterized membrane protein YkoI